jgi:hypothetical protein
MTEQFPNDIQELMEELNRAVPPNTHATTASDDPLVEAARRLANGPKPALPDSALDRIEMRLRARHAAILHPAQATARQSSRARQAARSRWARVRRTLRYVAAVLLVLVLFTSGLTAASASSLPGDQLYTVKLGVEEIRLLLVSADGEPALRVTFAGRRLDEFETLLVKRQTIDPAVLEEASAQMNRALTLLVAGHGDRQELDSQIAELTYQQAELIQTAAGTAAADTYARLQLVSEWNSALYARVVTEGTVETSGPALASDQEMPPTLPERPSGEFEQPTGAQNDNGKPDDTPPGQADKPPPGQAATPGLGLGRDQDQGQDKDKDNQTNNGQGIGQDKDKDKKKDPNTGQGQGNNTTLDSPGNSQGNPGDKPNPGQGKNK